MECSGSACFIFQGEVGMLGAHESRGLGDVYKTQILVCKAPRANTQWAASVSKIDIWLGKANTMPDIRRAIVSRLHEWRSDERFQDPLYTWPGVNDLIRDQDQVGWENVFGRRHATELGC